DERQGEGSDGPGPRALRRGATPGEPGATAIPGEHQPDGEAEDEAVVPGERREADEEARRDVGPRAALETKDGEPDGRRDERLEDREVLGLGHEDRAGGGDRREDPGSDADGSSGPRVAGDEPRQRRRDRADQERRDRGRDRRRVEQDDERRLEERRRRQPV